MVKLSSERKNKLRSQLIQYLNSVDSVSETVTDIKLFGFYGGLRLTPQGNDIMKSVFEHYTFQIKSPLTIKEKVTLTNTLETCFYIGTNNFIIYDKNESASIVLLDDISFWISTIAD